MLNLLRRLAIPLIGALLAAQALASDSTLDNMWFKVQIKASGYLVPLDGGAVQKGTISTTAYLHMTLATVAAAPSDAASLPTVTYGYEVWTRDLAGHWTIAHAGSEPVELSDGQMYFTTDMSVTVSFPDGPTVDGHVTCAFKVKRDKTGAVKSATIRSLGGDVHGGTLDGNDTVRGGLSIKGKSVTSDKLPF